MKTLIAGIGNIFLGDDGFGVEVARRLAEQRFDDSVRVGDFGIRGVHLAYEISSGLYDQVILVDAAPRGGAPGSLYAIEPDPNEAPAADVDAHNLTPAVLLAWVRRIGAHAARVVVVGCEPQCLDEVIGLSAPVAGAVDGAIAMIRELVARRAPAV